MSDPAVFVCGLGRCGTSLLMQMLQRGGVPTLGAWPAFECGETTLLPGRHGAMWLNHEAPGHAVKILDPYRWTPPRDLPAIVFWLDRDPAQQALSQIKFHEAFGFAAADGGSRRARRRIIAGMARERLAALAALDAPNRHLQIIRFEDLVERPDQSARTVTDFLAAHDGPRLDPVRAAAAALPRTSDCYPGMLEIQILAQGKPEMEAAHG